MMTKEEFDSFGEEEERYQDSSYPNVSEKEYLEMLKLDDENSLSS